MLGGMLMEEMIFQRLQYQLKSVNVTSLISSKLFIQRTDNFYKLTFNVSKRIFKEINLCLDSKILRLISTCQLILMRLIMVWLYLCCIFNPTSKYMILKTIAWALIDNSLKINSSIVLAYKK